MSEFTQSGTAQSAVGVVVETICGRDVAVASETIQQIGFETFKAEKAMSSGQAARDVCDANLHDWLKGHNYVEFMKAHDQYLLGAIDGGASATPDGAQKVWERQINRMISTFDFVRPKSEAKDAVRKQEAKAKEVAALAEFSDGALDERKAELLAKGDTKSVREALKLNKEIERRNADSISAETAQRKAMVDKLIIRVKELGKAGTADADELLIKALALLA